MRLSFTLPGLYEESLNILSILCHMRMTTVLYNKLEAHVNLCPSIPKDKSVKLPTNLGGFWLGFLLIKPGSGLLH